MKFARTIIAIGILLLAVVGCYWLFVVHPILPIVLVGLVLLIGYSHGPEIIDLALRNTDRRN